MQRDSVSTFIKKTCEKFHFELLPVKIFLAAQSVAILIRDVLEKVFHSNITMT